MHKIPIAAQLQAKFKQHMIGRAPFGTGRQKNVTVTSFHKTAYISAGKHRELFHDHYG